LNGWISFYLCQKKFKLGKIHLKYKFFKYKLRWKYDITLNFVCGVPVPNNVSWVLECLPSI
jgi:hypothetical protein